MATTTTTMANVNPSLWHTSTVKRPALPSFLLANWLAPEIDNSVGKYSSLTRHNDGGTTNIWNVTQTAAMRESLNFDDVVGCSSVSLESTASLTIALDLLHEAVIIGKFDNKVWLLDFPSADYENRVVIAVDQHALHERLRLEQFETAIYDRCEELVWKDNLFKEPKKISNIKLLELVTPISVTAVDLDDKESVANLRIVIPAVDGASFLKRYGLVCAYHDGNHGAMSVVVKSMPFILHDLFNLSDREAFEQLRQFLTKYLRDVAELFVSDRNDQSRVQTIPRALESLLASFACKGAIKFDDDIDRPYFERLLKKWAFCRDPWHCAHGRPTAAIVKLSSKLLTNRQTYSAASALPADGTEMPLKIKEFLLD